MNKRITEKKFKNIIRYSAVVLAAIVLVLSGVGIYFAVNRKPAEEETPVMEVNPLTWSYSTWDGTSEDNYSWLNGSEFANRGSLTFTIDSAESFVYFVNLVNNPQSRTLKDTYNYFKGYTVYLNKNIDLNGLTIKSIGKKVVSQEGEFSTFQGTFDGSYYSIFNANIDGDGLFGYVKDATIKNIGLYNSTINSTGSYVGGIAGVAVDTIIDSVYVNKCNITGADVVGGLVGSLEKTKANSLPSISNSFADSTLKSSTKKVGGLVGRILTNQTNENRVRIKTCYYTSSNDAYYAADSAFVTATSVIKPQSKSNFLRSDLNWDYVAEYSLDHTWCDYSYLENSTKLEFNFPILSLFNKVFMTGSAYENVVYKNGEAVNSVDLTSAISSVKTNEEAEINVIIPKVYVEESISTNTGADIVLDAAVDTTFVRNYENKETEAEVMLFAASGSSLTLGSENSNKELVFDGQRNYVQSNNLKSNALLVVNSSDFKCYDNVTFKNNVNNTTEIGGAIVFDEVGYNSNSNEYEQIVVDGLKIENCTAKNGGAIAIIDSNIEFTEGCEISSCTAENGGAIAITSRGDSSSAHQAEQLARRLNNNNLSNLLFTDIYSSRWSNLESGQTISTATTLTNVSISGCSATNGGGIYMSADVTLESGSITNCSATNGGGIYIASGTLTIPNNATPTITSNTASAYGGGIYNQAGSLVGASSTIINSNTATTAGNNTYGCGYITLIYDGAWAQVSANASRNLNESSVSNLGAVAGDYYWTSQYVVVPYLDTVPVNTAPTGYGIAGYGASDSTTRTLNVSAVNTYTTGIYYAVLTKTVTVKSNVNTTLSTDVNYYTFDSYRGTVSNHTLTRTQTATFTAASAVTGWNLSGYTYDDLLENATTTNSINTNSASITLYPIYEKYLAIKVIDSEGGTTLTKRTTNPATESAWVTDNLSMDITGYNFYGWTTENGTGRKVNYSTISGVTISGTTVTIHKVAGVWPSANTITVYAVFGRCYLVNNSTNVYYPTVQDAYTANSSATIYLTANDSFEVQNNSTYIRLYNTGNYVLSLTFASSSVRSDYDNGTTALVGFISNPNIAHVAAPSGYSLALGSLLNAELGGSTYTAVNVYLRSTYVVDWQSSNSSVISYTNKIPLSASSSSTSTLSADIGYSNAGYSATSLTVTIYTGSDSTGTQLFTHTANASSYSLSYSISTYHAKYYVYTTFTEVSNGPQLAYLINGWVGEVVSNAIGEINEDEYTINYADITKIIFTNTNMASTATVEFDDVEYAKLGDPIDVGTTNPASTTPTNIVQAYVYYNVDEELAVVYLYTAASNNTATPIYAPDDSSYLFSGSTKATRLTYLEEIVVSDGEDVFFLVDSNVTDMSYMYNYCTSLKEVDMSGWDISNVTTMYRMFYYDSSLTTIYASLDWDATGVSTSGQMFYRCTSLEGMDGTTYSASHVDATYAVIDGYDSGVGYLSTKELATYTVHFNKNDNAATGTMADLECMYDTDTTLSPNTFAKAGYNFIGWATTANGSPVYDNNGTINISDTEVTEITLYAVWQERTYSTTLASGIEATPSGAARYSQTVTIEAVYEREGYTISNESIVVHANNVSGATLATINLNNARTATFNLSTIGTYYTAVYVEYIKTETANAYNIYLNGSAFEIAGVAQTYTISNEAQTFNLGVTGATISSNSQEYDSSISGSTLTIPAGAYGDIYIYSPYTIITQTTPASYASIALTNVTGAQSPYSANYTANVGITATYSRLGYTGTISSLIISGSQTENGTYTQLKSINGTVGSFNLESEIGSYYPYIKIAATFIEAESVVTYDIYKNGEYYISYRYRNTATSLDINTDGNSEKGYSIIQNTTGTGAYITGSTLTIPAGDYGHIYIEKVYIINHWKILLPNNVELSDIQHVKFTNSLSDVEGLTPVANIGTYNANPPITINSGANGIAKMYYNSTTNTVLFYSIGKINAPDNCSELFKNLTNVTSIDFTNFAFATGVNASSMFENCSSLTSLNLSTFDTSSVTNMSKMFKGCSSLTSLTLHNSSLATGTNFDTSNVTDMSEMFSGCVALTSYDITHFNTSGALNMSAMFKNNTAVTTLSLTNFSTANVTNMSEMFSGCSNLATLTLHNTSSATGTTNFNTSSVTNMSNMFYGCEDLTSADVTHFNTSAVTDMSNMFYNCSSVSTFSVSNFNTANVTTMAGMFYGTTVSTLNVESFNTANVTDMSTMFAGNTSLTTIYVGVNWYLGSLSTSTNMFLGSTSLVGDNGTTYNAEHVDGTYAKVDGGSSSTNPGYLSTHGFAINFLINGGTNGVMLQRVYALNTEYDLPNNLYSFTGRVYRGWSRNAADTTPTFENRATFSSTSFQGVSVTEGTVINLYAIWSKTYLYSEWVTRVSNNLVSSYNIQHVVFTNDTEDLPANYATSNSVNLGSYYDNPNENSLMNGIVAYWDSDTQTIYIYSKSYAYAPQYSSNLFANLNNVTSFDFENFRFDSNVTSSYQMFYNDKALTSVDVSTFNTSNVTNMEYMFQYCSSLTSIDISDWDTSSVYYMDYMFYGCSALTTFTHTGINTSNVTNMNYMFNGCSSLTTIDLTDLNVSCVTNFSGMFCNCTALTTIDMSYWTLKNTNYTDIYMDDMFYGCSSLTGVTFSHIDTSGAEDVTVTVNFSRVYSMQEMFRYCTSLEEIDLSMLNLSRVYRIDYLFYGCSNLETIDMSGLTLTNLYTGNGNGYSYYSYAFGYCQNLDTIDMSGCTFGSNFTYYRYLFYCSSNTSDYRCFAKHINFANVVAPYVNYAYYMFYNCTELISVDLTNFNLTANKSYAENNFYTQYMFYNCSSLTTITFTGMETYRWYNSYYMFYNCSSLTSLDLSTFDTSYLYSAYYMFNGCSSLESIDLSTWVTTNLYQAYYMFANCTSLEEIDLTSFSTNNLYYVYNMFYNCSSLTTIKVSASWNRTSFSSSGSMFYGCTSLVGGSGTVYNSSYTDGTYARIDRIGYPGYLTGLVVTLDYYQGFTPSDTGTHSVNFYNTSYENVGSWTKYRNASSFSVNANNNTISVTTMSDNENIGFNMAVTPNVQHTLKFNYSIDKDHRLYDGTSGAFAIITTTNAANIGNNTSYLARQFFPRVRTENGQMTLTFTTSASSVYIDFCFCNIYDGQTVVFGFSNFSFDNKPLYSLYNSQTIAQGGRLTMPTEPTKTNYVFRGWFTDQALTQCYNFNHSITSDMSFYAGWQEMVNTGYTSKTIVDISSNYNSNSNFYTTNPGTTDEEAPAYYYFKARNTGDYEFNYKTDGTVTAYIEIIDVTDNNKVLATDDYSGSVFRTIELENLLAGHVFAVKVYTSESKSNCFSFYVSGTTPLNIAPSGTPAKTNVGKQHGTYTTTYGYLPYPARDGYDFVGWFTESTGGTQVLSDTVATATTDHTLYAHWNVRTYHIHFNANLESATGTMSVMNCDYDTEYNLTANQFVSEQFFTGWALTPTGEVVYTDGQLIKNLLPDTTTLELYAVWSKVYLAENWQTILAASINASTEVKFITDLEDIPAQDLTQLTKYEIGSLTSTEQTTKAGLVTAYVHNNIIYVYSAYEILAPNDSSDLFAGLAHLDLNNFFVRDNVTDLSSMFEGVADLKVNNSTDLDFITWDVSSVLDMSAMFKGCSGVTSIDLTGWDTSLVEDMSEMFSGCSALTTVYVGSTWSTESIESSSDSANMFLGCLNIEGRNGTTYDSTHIDKTYARIDTVTSAGYFSTLGVEIKFDINHNISGYPTMESMIVDFGEDYNITTNTSYRHPDYTFLGWSLNALDYEDYIGNNYANVNDILDDIIFLDEDDISTDLLYEKLTDANADLSLANQNNIQNNSIKRGATITLYAVWAKVYLVSNWKDTFAAATNSVTEVHFINSLATLANVENMTTVEAGIGSLNPAASSAENNVVEVYKNGNVLYIYSNGTIFAPANSSYLFSGDSTLTYKLTALTTLDLTNFRVDDQAASLDHMFYNANHLTTLTNLNIADWDMSNAGNTNLSYMFAGMSAITSLNLTDFDTSRVTNMSYMFSSDSALTALNLTDFSTSNVTTMQGMFKDDSSLATLTLHDSTLASGTNFNTSNVENMGEMFSGCSALTSADISHFNTYNVTDMNAMFKNCSTLTSLVLTNFYTAYVSDMSEMFSGCSGLTTLTLHDSTRATGTNFVTVSARDLSEMFSGCSALTSLDVSHFNTSIARTMKSMFAGCVALTGLNVYGFDTQGVTDMSGMFSNCRALTTLTLGELNPEHSTNFNPVRVTDMSTMFSNCRALTTLDLSNWTLSTSSEDNINMNQMFYTCSALTELNLSNWDTTRVNNMTEMFRSCGNLETIFVTSDWNASGVASSNYMFSGCGNLVGGHGTVYNSNNVNKAYAVIDTATTPGYLTFFGYVVNFDGNGATGGTMESVTYNSSVDYTLPKNRFENPRYIFKGWALSADGEAVFDKEGTISSSLLAAQGVTVGRGSQVTLYAVWSEVFLLKNWQTILTNDDIDLTEIRSIYFTTETPNSEMYTAGSVYEIMSTNPNATVAEEGMGKAYVNRTTKIIYFVRAFAISAPTDSTQLFAGLTSLITLDFTNFVLNPNVTNTTEMFKNTSSLANLDLSTFNMIHVATSVDMFAGCESLYSIVTPMNVQALTPIALNGLYSKQDLSDPTQSITAALSSTTTTSVTLYRSYTISFYSNSSLYTSVIRIVDTTYTLPTDPTQNGYTFVGWASELGAPADWLADSVETKTCRADRSWYAVFNINVYTITYVLGDCGPDGENSPYNVDSYTVEDDQILLYDPSSTGYAFIGWYRENTFSNTINSIPTGSTGDITVYARWQATPYTLYYDLNYGDNFPVSQTYYYGAQTSPIETPTRAGYTFENWYYDEDCLFLYVFNTMPNYNVTVYAHWEPTMVTITYHDVISGDGPYYQDEIQTDSYYSYIEGRTIEGYRFAGWSKTTNSMQDRWTQGIELADQSTDWYAIYVQEGGQDSIGTITHTFYTGLNESYTWDVTNEYYEGVYYNYLLTVEIANQEEPLKIGPLTYDHEGFKTTTTISNVTYTFVGWTSDPTSNVPEWTSGVRYEKTASTWYAVWKLHVTDIQNLSHTFYVSSSETNTAYSAYDADRFYNYTLDSANVRQVNGKEYLTIPTNPTIEGYTFLGWSTTESGTTQLWTSALNRKEVTNSTTWYAIWQRVVTTYNTHTFVEGKDGNEDITETAETHFDTTTTHSYKLAVLKTSTQRAYLSYKSLSDTNGYKHLGWSNAANSYTLVWYETNSGGFPIEVNTNTTWYAVWSRSQNITNYTHTFHTIDDLTSEVDTTYVQTISYTYDLSASSNPSNGREILPAKRESGFTRSGVTYSFVGWASANGSTAVAWDGNREREVSSNTEWYAVWQYTKTTPHFQHTFYVGAGENDVIQYNSTYTSTIKVDHTLAHPSAQSGREYISQSASKSGYEFRGWATSPNSTSVAWYGSSRLVTSDTVWYAVWRRYETRTLTHTFYYSDTNTTRTTTYDHRGDWNYNISVEGNVRNEDFTRLYYFSVSRSGYEFAGWATSGSSYSVAWGPKQDNSYNYQRPGTNLTYYAVWKKDSTVGEYTHTFNVYNLITFTRQSTATRTVYYNYNVTASNSSFNNIEYLEYPGMSETDIAGYNMSDYNFLGWADSSTATRANWSNGRRSFTSSSTWYAVWEKKDMTGLYSHNFYTDSAEYTSSSSYYIKPVTFNYNLAQSTIPAEKLDYKSAENKVIGGVTYTFMGWSSSQNGNSAEWTSGTKDNITGNTNWYAVYRHYEERDNMAHYFYVNATTKVTRYSHYQVTVYSNYNRNVTYNREIAADTEYLDYYDPDIKTNTDAFEYTYTYQGWSNSSAGTAVVWNSSTAQKVVTETTNWYSVYKKDNRNGFITHTFYKEVVDDNTLTDTNVYSHFNADLYASYDLAAKSLTTEYLSNRTIETTDTEENYEFLGWSSDSSATTASWAKNSNTEQAVTSSSNWYAIWKHEEDRENIAHTFYNYGSSDTVYSVYHVRIYHNYDRTVHNEDRDPEYLSYRTLDDITDGTYTYTFVGWTKNSDSTVATWSRKSGYTQAAITDAKVEVVLPQTYYPVWYCSNVTKPQSVTLLHRFNTYDNGYFNINSYYTYDRVGSMYFNYTLANYTEDQVTTQNEVYSFTMPGEDIETSPGVFETDPRVLRRGYIFTGWATTENGTASKQAGDTYQSKVNTTWFATWEACVYTISYRDKGGAAYSGSNLASLPTTHRYDARTTLVDGEKAAYTFGGWFMNDIDCEGSAITYIDLRDIDSNVTLYANWIPIQYTITYDLNNGTNNANNPSTYTIEDTPITLLAASKTGYTFDGWFTENTFENEVTQVAAGSYGNKTYYAKWLGVPPIVSISSNKNSVDYSESYTLTAVASHALGIASYQWYRSTTEDFTISNGTIISGATNSTYTEGTLNVGTYYYKCVVTSNTDDASTATSNEVSVVINRAAPTYTAPTAKDSLVYTGEAQELINAGSTSHGEFEYKLGDGEWGVAIPEATNAGSYTVQWRLNGDSNHTSVEAHSISVTIAKATLVNGAYLGTTYISTQNYVGTYDINTHYATITTTVDGLVVSSDSAITNENTGTLIANVAGTFNLLPGKADAGSYTIYYKVTDMANFNDYASTASISIAKANQEISFEITGTNRVTFELSVSNLSYLGDGTVSYQWSASYDENGTFVDIEGATSSSYILTLAETDKYIRCTVSVSEGSNYFEGSHAETTEDTCLGVYTLTFVTPDYSSTPYNIVGTVGSLDVATAKVIHGTTVTVNGNALTFQAINVETRQQYSVTVTATAETGYVFESWSIANGSAINDDTTITAYFGVEITAVVSGNYVTEDTTKQVKVITNGVTTTYDVTTTSQVIIARLGSNVNVNATVKSEVNAENYYQLMYINYGSSTTSGTSQGYNDRFFTNILEATSIEIVYNKAYKYNSSLPIEVLNPKNKATYNNDDYIIVGSDIRITVDVNYAVTQSGLTYFGLVYTDPAGNKHTITPSQNSDHVTSTMDSNVYVYTTDLNLWSIDVILHEEVSRVLDLTGVSGKGDIILVSTVDNLSIRVANTGNVDKEVSLYSGEWVVYSAVDGNIFTTAEVAAMFGNDDTGLTDVNGNPIITIVG